MTDPLADFDDRPYHEVVPDIHPMYTVYGSLPESDNNDAPVWLYVDHADGRIARQQFTNADVNPPTMNTVVADWLREVIDDTLSDTLRGCGECGNVTKHAPDCPYANWKSPIESNPWRPDNNG